MVADDGSATVETSASSKLFKYKVLKTCTLISMWMTAGLFASFLSTTLVDFKEKLNTDYEKLGTALVLRTVGATIGGLAGCVLRDALRIQADLILGILAAFFSLVNFLKPWSSSVAFFGLLVGVEGFAMGCANTVNNAMLLNMWGEKGSVPIHFFHFGYGFGAFLGPMLMKEFLSVPCPTVESIFNTTQNRVNSTNNSTELVNVVCQNSTPDNPVILKQSRLEIPFSIGAGISTLVCCTLTTFYLLEKFSLVPGTQSGKHKPKPVNICKFLRKPKCKFIKSFFCQFVVGMFLLYMCIVTFEGVLYSYLFTFAYESGTGFTKPEATDLSSAYFGAYTLSRLLASIIAHFVSVKIMVFVELVGTLVSLLGMLFAGFQSKIGMWVSACCLGVFSAPVWPSGFAWGDRFIPVNAFVVGCTDISASISASVCVWVAGHLVDIGQPRSYLYLASAAAGATIALLTLMQVLGQRHGDRHEKAQI